MTVSEKHWDAVYRGRPADTHSWYQRRSTVSARLIDQALAPRTDMSIVDVGAGASSLVDALLAAGHDDLTLVDVSAEALGAVVLRLGEYAAAVTPIHTDLLTWQPGRSFDVWHDRAVLHFLGPDDVAVYVELAGTAVATGGALVLGVFAHDGPTSCSGLPTARYDAHQLASLFAPAFELEHAEREEHRTPAGALQAFTWVVLRRRGASGLRSVVSRI